MPLYDISHGGKPRLIKHAKIEKNDVFTAIKNRVKKATWDRLLKTVHEAVESILQQDPTKLTWTRAGVLFGYNSNQPLKRVNHLWDSIINVVGDGKMCKLGVGCLLQHNISQRPEKWFMIKRETGEWDKEEDKEITIREYWINENAVI